MERRLSVVSRILSIVAERCISTDLAIESTEILRVFLARIQLLLYEAWAPSRDKGVELRKLNPAGHEVKDILA